MTRHIDVKIDPNDPELDPITFTLHGQTRQGEAWDETFTVLPTLPAPILDELMNVKRTDPRTGKTIIDQISVQRLLVGILIPEDEQRMTDLFADKNRLVPLTALAKVLMDSVRLLTGVDPSMP